MQDIEIHLYARGVRPTAAEANAVDVIRSRLGAYARHIRRVGTRLVQAMNGRGDLDQVCRVEVVLSKVLDAPRFLVEGRARNAQEAAHLAADAVEGAVRREIESTDLKRSSASSHKRKVARARASQGPRRLEVRREAAEMELGAEAEVKPGPEELEREERHLTPRRVKTAHPQRGRHIHKTQRQARATSAREISATPRPSRKSTRKSANRSKRDSNQARRTERDVRSASARASRSAARATRGGRRIAPGA